MTVSCACFVASVGGAMDDLGAPRMRKYRLYESVQKMSKLNGSILKY